MIKLKKISSVLMCLISSAVFALGSTAAVETTKTVETKTSEALATEKNNFTQENIIIKGKNNKKDVDIVATLVLPKMAEKDSRFACVIMFHGTGSNKDEVGDDYKNLAAELAKNGIASLRIDFAGAPLSKRDYLDFSISGCVQDANSAIKYASEHKNINPKKIGLIGYSQGALTAQIVASQNKNIAACVLWAPVTGVEMWQSNKADYSKAKKDGFVVKELGFRDPIKVSLKWYDELSKTNTLIDIKKYSNPLLCVHGTADTSVDPKNSTNIVSAASSKDASVYYIKGADHIFGVFEKDKTQVNELIDVTANWFSRKLG